MTPPRQSSGGVRPAANIGTGAGTESTPLLADPGRSATSALSRRASRIIPYHTDDYTPHSPFSAEADVRDHEEWLGRLGASGSSSGSSTPQRGKGKPSQRGGKSVTWPKPGVLVPVQTVEGKSTTKTLAMYHGVDHSWWGYASYYVPFLSWSSKYRLSYLKGDFIAALTMASIYIPMSLSYATSIAGAPAINGMYSYAFQPVLYALFGSSTLMVVGPEAAGSLLVGTVVREALGSGHDPDAHSARIVGLVTGLSGAISLVAGLTRLGYLDTVLSRPFLRGFISAIGVTIIIDQLTPELGLKALAREAGLSNASSWQKLVFVARSVMQGKAHDLTAGVAVGAFVLCFVFK
ncbi:hypothetical protein KEM52_005769 [Ascosphaera acerosa]|nr:hypothetical protein KEM52_005769 [Ascosphaera acerosa]